MSADRSMVDGVVMRYLRTARKAFRERPFGLGAMAAPWSGKIAGTSWARRGLTGRGSRGERWEKTMSELAVDRVASSMRVAAKGDGEVCTLATTDAGSCDDECVARTGLFLDSDFSGGWDRILEAFGRAGIAYLAQRRAGKKFHVLVPYAKPIAISRFRAFKGEYMRRVGWTLGIMSELAWPGDDSTYFDPSTANRYGVLEYVYSRRAEDDEVPGMRWADGRALDLGGVLALSGFQSLRHLERAAAKGPPIPVNVPMEGAPTPCWKDWTTNPVRARMVELRAWKARRRHRDFRHDDHFTLLDRVLKGEAFASPHGRGSLPPRHDAIVQLAGLLAESFHRVVPFAPIAAAVLPAFQAVDWTDEDQGRDAGDWGHGMEVFEELFDEFRARQQPDRATRDYAGEDRVQAYLDGKAKKDG